MDAGSDGAVRGGQATGGGRSNEWQSLILGTVLVFAPGALMPYILINNTSVNVYSVKSFYSKQY